MARTLKVVRARPIANPLLIDLLKELMKDAKSGELQTLAYVGECRDNGVVCGTTDKKDQARMIGALARLQYRLCQDMD